MHRNHFFAAQVAHRPYRVIGKNVVVSPVFIPGVDFHKHIVERAVRLADLTEMPAVTAVAGYEHFPAAGGNDERRPQRPAAIVKRPPGKMPRLARRHHHAADHQTLPPVQLMDFVRVDQPAAQTRANPERTNKFSIRASQHGNGRIFKMIVMVVGEDYKIKFRQIAPRQRRINVTPHRKRDRRRVAEHRIDHESGAVQLEQQRRMAEPAHRSRVLFRRGGKIGRRNFKRRDRLFRCIVGKNHPPYFRTLSGGGAAFAPFRRLGVVKFSVRVVRQSGKFGGGLGGRRFAQLAPDLHAEYPDNKQQYSDNGKNGFQNLFGLDFHSVFYNTTQNRSNQIRRLENHRFK